MSGFLDPSNAGWSKAQDLVNRSFDCGYCGDRVSSTRGLKIGQNKDGSGTVLGGIWICTNCYAPNAFAPDGTRFPAPSFGHPVANVPAELDALYAEARRCTSHSCYTGAVLLCRKMLMNIAVHQGADEGLKFIEYVDYLATTGFIPPNGRPWVDHIRKKGNEATHEIALMTEQDSKELIIFIEMLLRFIYEFPSMVPTGTP